MKKKIMILIGLLFHFSIFAQKYVNDRRTIFFVEVREANSREIANSGGIASGDMRLFNGTLSEGIHFLLDCTPARTKVIGSIPPCFIHYDMRPPCNMDKVLMKSLADYYGFEIQEMKEIREVWTLKAKDFNKLRLHEFDIVKADGGIYGPNDTTQSWGGTAVPLSEFCRYLEIYSGCFVIDEAQLNVLYEFEQIPFKDMASFEIMHKLLIDKYGLELTREKRLESIKVIKFDPEKGTRNFQIRVSESK